MKRTFLTSVVAGLPTYLSLFAPAIAAAAIMVLATLVGAVISSYIDPESEKELSEKAVLGWCIHLVGIALVVAYHNFF